MIRSFQTNSADNRFSEESSLHIPNDYMSYGGITRGVVLEELTCAYIKWIHITPEKQGETWKAGLALCISNISDEDITLDAKITIHPVQAANLKQMMPF